MPFSISQKSVRELIEDPCIDIPEHQRPYIWKPKTASSFIDTILLGLPTHALILYQEIKNGELKKWLEDGQQRFMTVKKFIDGTLPNVFYEMKTYEELSEPKKAQIRNYQFTICTLERVPYELRISLFQRLQDGKPLTNGQRFNAASGTPLVQLAKQILKDPRCSEIWGQQKDNDSYTKLSNAVAIAAGLNLASDDHITSSYDILGTDNQLIVPINEELSNQRLNKLFDVYLKAQELCAINLKKRTTEFNVGKYTGYILYNIRQLDINWEQDSQMWIKYIVECRQDKTRYKVLAFEQPSSRNWTRERWEIGLKNVRNPERVPADYYAELVDDDED